MDRETWHAAVHGVTKSRTKLSNWTELNSNGKHNKIGKHKKKKLTQSLYEICVRKKYFLSEGMMRKIRQRKGFGKMQTKPKFNVLPFKEK